jgi:hypothetical protein
MRITPVFTPPEDYLVRISVCSMMSLIQLDPFRIELDDESFDKINRILEQSRTSDFLVFPEYMYSNQLENLFQQYCNETNCVIIGGSGLEPATDGYYAYCPIFLPNSLPSKVYKRYITTTETMYSGSTIVPYDNENQRSISITKGNKRISFSVYLCSDFIYYGERDAATTDRNDIIFIPQYEPSPNQFIVIGDRISKGCSTFILGANNSNDNQRSLGFATLNSDSINALRDRQFRRATYSDGDGNQMDYHHTIFYDFQNEMLFQFDINVGRPFALPFIFAHEQRQPVVVPINRLQLT